MQPNQQETADSVTFTEEILNGKFYILCKQIKTKQNRNNLKDMKQKQMLKCKLHKQNVCVCVGEGGGGGWVGVCVLNLTCFQLLTYMKMVLLEKRGKKKSPVDEIFFFKTIFF